MARVSVAESQEELLTQGRDVVYDTILVLSCTGTRRKTLQKQYTYANAHKDVENFLLQSKDFKFHL